MVARANGHEIIEIRTCALRALENGCLMEEHILWHILTLIYLFLAFQKNKKI